MTLNSEFKEHLGDLINAPILNVQPVSGGDISLAYKLTTVSKSYFLKVNTGKDAYSMFLAESHGLKTIANTRTIATPKVHACGSIQNDAFLLMDYIEPKHPNNEDYYNLGEKLAQLHQYSRESFGLESNNYIGSLSQSNTSHDTWIDFYVKERLVPQLSLSLDLGNLIEDEIPSQELMKESLSNYLNDTSPALLHGDLWNGNFIVSKDGIPFLIDPAAYFGDYLVDLAMSKLFGGFGETFYKAHTEHFTRVENFDERIELYQLYYLLVHLNLFGQSYYDSVKHIMGKYF